SYPQKIEEYERQLALNQASVSPPREIVDGLAFNIRTLEKELVQTARFRELLQDLQRAADSPAINSASTLLDRLKLLGKRVVLFFDNFEALVGERDPATKAYAIEDRLFEFLRGAANEGKVTALIASHAQVWDPSFFPPGPAGAERAALFNHFKEHL